MYSLRSPSRSEGFRPSSASTAAPQGVSPYDSKDLRHVKASSVASSPLVFPPSPRRHRWISPNLSQPTKLDGPLLSSCSSFLLTVLALLLCLFSLNGSFTSSGSGLKVLSSALGSVRAKCTRRPRHIRRLELLVNWFRFFLASALRLAEHVASLEQSFVLLSRLPHTIHVQVFFLTACQTILHDFKLYRLKQI